MARKKEVIADDPRAQVAPVDDDGFTLRSMAGPLASSGLILLVGVTFIYNVKGNWQHKPHSLMAVAGAVLLLLGLIGNRGAVRGFIRSRHTQSAVNTFVSVGLMLGILALLNVIAFRHDRKFDWTKEGTNTVDRQTIKILKRVDVPLEITYFYAGRSGQGSTTRLLDNYQYYNSKVKVRRVNIETNPDLARQEGIQAAGSAIVVNMKSGRKERLNTVDEQSLDSAILKVLTDAQRTILFLKGHGEHELSDSNPGGYGNARKILEDMNHKVDSISLIGKTAKDLEACDLLVVAGPTNDLLEEEADAIREYLLKRKGSALFMIEPPDFKMGDLTRPATPQLNELVARVGGVDIQKGVLLEFQNTLAGALMGARGGVVFSAPVDASKHEALRPLDRGGDVIFMVASAMRTKTPSGTEAPTVTPLIESSSQSWCETSKEQIATREVKSDTDDPKGPLVLAAAATIAPAAESTSKKSTKVVTVGDSDFACNDPRLGLGTLDNGRFFQAIVNWLVAAEGESLNIVPPRRTPNQITLTGEEFARIRWMSMLPGVLCLMAGIAVWWRRR